ncbi:MAG: hypothetical protein WCX31_21210 [Salinivirgaceae bacterium]
MIQLSYLSGQNKQRFSGSTIFLLLSFVFLFLSNTSKAQKDTEHQEYQTLFGNNITHGGYGGLSIGYTKIGTNDALYSGFKGAWIVGHGIGIGIAGNGMVTELAADLFPNQEYSFISAGYGGLLLEPILFGLKPVHISMPIIIGTGAVVFDSGNYNEMSNSDVFWRQFFVVEPALEIEMNVTRFFRLAVGGSYRFTSDTDMVVTVLNEPYTVVGKNDLNTYNVYLSFKFGKF